ncbi:hypothetical protein PPL_07764 [Heterostelium album PN500]|uniref:Uncharacterized protein n=1 Tax=Heterostelium pallidum (strain ATCC 26659 / Pp 5 / PN500) TaxID=670386 RepID=D3BGW2_HETP5|nr:hypothetical protein PPL_07764 [Heterostelium album PN500]EFA79346.1 hypothetical protein PPL_07764 [Heterostelium album PN500]|eukprot:XP_020431467.1 hypothetical protein PPL_07764 [Heterostelium album PN500]
MVKDHSSYYTNTNINTDHTDEQQLPKPEKFIEPVFGTGGREIDGNCPKCQKIVKYHVTHNRHFLFPSTRFIALHDSAVNAGKKCKFQWLQLLEAQNEALEQWNALSPSEKELQKEYNHSRYTQFINKTPQNYSSRLYSITPATSAKKKDTDFTTAATTGNNEDFDLEHSLIL